MAQQYTLTAKHVQILAKAPVGAAPWIIKILKLGGSIAQIVAALSTGGGAAAVIAALQALFNMLSENKANADKVANKATKKAAAKK